MSERFFVETPIEGKRAVVRGPEAHHLIHVMRFQPGDEVILFDGSGSEYPGLITRLGRSDVEVEVQSRETIDRELPYRLTLGVSLPKGERQKWLVEKCVELGVGTLVPLRTARSVAQPADQSLGRLRRTVIEASKQCRRNRLMQVAEATDWQGFLAAAPAAAWRLIAHPGSVVQGSEGLAQGSQPAVPLLQNQPESLFLAVGPEGGFTEEEVAVAIAGGWQTLDLGPRVLRVETAAIFLVAWAIVQLGRQ